MFGLGVGEIGIILFIALVFIGPKKLPELAKGLGKGMREFQNAMKGMGVQDTMDQIRDQIQEAANTQPRETTEQQFKDDPEHDQNLPEDEPAAEPEVAYIPPEEAEVIEEHPDYEPDSGMTPHDTISEEEIDRQWEEYARKQQEQAAAKGDDDDKDPGANS